MTLFELLNNPLFPYLVMATGVAIGSIIWAVKGEMNLRYLRQTAGRDPLTGLFNRAGLTERLQRMLDNLQDSKTRNRGLAVVAMDLNGFKALNDTLGHAVGDKLLQAVARELERLLRTRDQLAHIARPGGDEFVILLDDIERRRVNVVLDRVGQAICDLRIPEVPGPVVSVAIGSEWHAPRGEIVTAQQALEHADALMYRSKRSGSREALVEDSVRRRVANA